MGASGAAPGVAAGKRCWGADESYASFDEEGSAWTGMGYGARQQLQRPRSLVSTSTPPIPTAPACVTDVLTSPDLLQLIFSFVVDETVESRGLLGQLSLVGPRWRDVANWDGFWKPIAENLLLVTKHGGEEVVGLGALGYRRYLGEYGRSLLYRRIWVGDDWTEGLELSFDVHDKQDGLRMLSASGPIALRYRFKPEKSHMLLRIGGTARKEVRGAQFSAASRDPLHHRFVSMEEYFRRSHEAEMPASICVRVMVTEKETGRKALVFESIKGSWRTQEPPADVRPFVTEGSFSVFLHHGRLSSHTGDTLEARLAFFVSPEPGQEGVGDQDKLWRLAGGDQDRYAEHSSLIGIDFRTVDSHCKWASRPSTTSYPTPHSWRAHS